MAISPPSGIALDVARAAEPEAIASAHAGLMRRAQGTHASAFDAGVVTTPAAKIASRQASAESMADASRKFEAMVLQTFISAMMPKNTEGTYGQGMAGDMWKSMMAEKLADTVAAGGGIGIADRLLRDFQLKGEAKMPVVGATLEAELAEGDRPAMNATPFVDLIERQLAREVGAEAASGSAGTFEN